MKNQFAPLVAFFLMAIFIFSSCKKEDKITTTPQTKTQLLTQSTWKFSGATVGTNDVTPFIQACQKDNVLTFTAAGAGNVNEGALKCNSGDPQSTPLTWNFQNGETVLFISARLFTGGSSNFTLVSLTETQLVVSQIITVSGSSQNAVVTFIH